jgi:hypothetical protein
MTNDDYELINGKLCLKDGRRLSVKTTFMDNRTDDRAWLTNDAGQAGLFLHRPGFRCLLSDTAAVAAKERAYQEYHDGLVSAYKGDAPPAGAYPPSSGEGTSCTINGRPGRLVRQGNVLVCTPTSHDARSDEDEDDNDKNNGDDEDEDDEENERPARRDRRWQSRDPQGRERGTVTEVDSLAQRMRDHQANMERIYQDRDMRIDPSMEKPAMTNKQQTLERKIVDVLQPDATVASADVAALIQETEAGIAKADKERAVDQALLSKLQERYQQVQDREQATAWLAEHDALKLERDVLAEELRKVYPNAIAQIMDLFVRLTNNNEALSALHQVRAPGVMQHLLSAELHARGVDSFSRDTPSLLTSVHLVDWDSGREIWPPPRPSMASAFAAVMPPDDSHRFSADWAKDNERRAAAQRAEQQRMADYYARTTKEQEERENKEARERFAASQRKNRV